MCCVLDVVMWFGYFDCLMMKWKWIWLRGLLFMFVVNVVWNIVSGRVSVLNVGFGMCLVRWCWKVLLLLSCRWCDVWVGLVRLMFCRLWCLRMCSRLNICG